MKTKYIVLKTVHFDTTTWVTHSRKRGEINEMTHFSFDYLILFPLLLFQFLSGFGVSMCPVPKKNYTRLPR